MSKIGAQEMKDCFQAFDVDADGVISKPDLAMAIRALGKNPTEADLKKIFSEITDNVDFGTLSNVYKKQLPTPQDQDKPCRNAFKLLDADNNGTIPESELRQMLATVGDAMSHQEIDILMEDVDVDELGRVHYHQLVDLMVSGCDELIR
eukprot:TRINITY_DN8405_c0_g1_i1.p1 TRINITY_DN8405_c0_g1~~TRINITY_DN8405_c0_g1_i1.p1  ORF type:complete len:167 (+),score=47.60 TRINITY_DN8405_c0_g1_i1:55-501(+)